MEDVSNQGRMIDELDKDEGVVLMSEKEEKKTKEVKDITGDAQVEGRQPDIYQIDVDHDAKVLKVVAAVSETVNVAAVVHAAVTEIVSTTAVVPIVTAALVKVAVPSTSEKEEWLSGIQRRNHWQRLLLKLCPRIKEKKAAKKRRRNEEVKDVEELKWHLEIVPDEDDDVFTEATPLARKVPVVDYQIVHINNKPHFKIIRADETHQLYLIMLVERRYLLSRFTLDQMLNKVRLQVEEQSEMSLELITFT
nr:hypothetical protein [Tanacetum cinerariifolium]